MELPTTTSRKIPSAMTPGIFVRLSDCSFSLSNAIGCSPGSRGVRVSVAELQAGEEGPEPGDAAQNQQQTHGEEDRRALMLFGVVLRFFGHNRADLHHDHRDDHQEDVLYHKETDAAVAHGRGHILEACAN